MCINIYNMYTLYTYGTRVCVCVCVYLKGEITYYALFSYIFYSVVSGFLRL